MADVDVVFWLALYGEPVQRGTGDAVDVKVAKVVPWDVDASPRDGGFHLRRRELDAQGSKSNCPASSRSSFTASFARGSGASGIRPAP